MPSVFNPSFPLVGSKFPVIESLCMRYGGFNNGQDGIVFGFMGFYYHLGMDIKQVTDFF